MRLGTILKIRDEPILKAIYEAVTAVHAQAYLVGGVVRNLALSRPLGFDYDIALSGKVKEIANLLAERLNGSPFALDKETGAYRVVVKSWEFGVGSSESKAQIHIDLLPLKGKDISEDLRKRDFTVNALALDIHAL
ncbi:MAG: hypothetical protein HY266_06885, partial [Deltaproteobacteria bacterium]|nr:hypothetical protein [Deltaproteobacteria bacterium]